MEMARGNSNICQGLEKLGVLLEITPTSSFWRHRQGVERRLTISVLLVADDALE